MKSRAGKWIEGRGGKTHCSVPVRNIGQSRCCYRRRAIEYEYRTLTRPEYEYEGIVTRWPELNTGPMQPSTCASTITNQNKKPCWIPRPDTALLMKKILRPFAARHGAAARLAQIERATALAVVIWANAK
ncbi:MAG: hypothetical protein KGQ51_01040 [Planctomycetes bacterium]|nr:hypothetical protein [Planctomycetota bacterium]